MNRIFEYKFKIEIASHTTQMDIIYIYIYSNIVTLNRRIKSNVFYKSVKRMVFGMFCIFICVFVIVEFIGNCWISSKGSKCDKISHLKESRVQLKWGSFFLLSVIPIIELEIHQKKRASLSE